MALLDILKNIKAGDLMGETVTPLDELKSKAEESMKHRMELTLMHLQAKLCKKFEEAEGKPFKVKRDVCKACSYVTCTIEDGEY